MQFGNLARQKTVLADSKRYRVEYSMFVGCDLHSFLFLVVMPGATFVVSCSLVVMCLVSTFRDIPSTSRSDGRA